MGIFKVPGSQNFKRILLGVLVIVSVIVLIKIGIDNRKSEVVEDKTVEETKIEEPKEEAKIEAVVNEEEENLYNDARSAFFQGDYSGTVEKANTIIKKFPDSYKAYNIRGFAKAFNVSFEEGMKDIDKALTIKPDYAYGLYTKAFNYELYERFEEALVYYDKSLALEADMWAYYGKASIYGRRGDVANTVANLKKAIEVEGAKANESGVKKEAKTEKDFDPVRGNAEFENLIK
jgi:tetratricopeptide (TPR) repeat protein